MLPALRNLVWGKDNSGYELQNRVEIKKSFAATMSKVQKEAKLIYNKMSVISKCFRGQESQGRDRIEMAFCGYVLDYSNLGPKFSLEMSKMNS